MQTATHGTVAVQDLEPVRLRIKTKYKRTKTEKPDPNYPWSNAEGERRQNRNKPAANSTHGTAMGSPNVGPQDRPKWESSQDPVNHKDDIYQKIDMPKATHSIAMGYFYAAHKGL